MGKNFQLDYVLLYRHKKDYGRNSKFTPSRTLFTFSSRLLHLSLASPNSLSRGGSIISVIKAGNTFSILVLVGSSVPHISRSHVIRSIARSSHLTVTLLLLGYVEFPISTGFINIHSASSKDISTTIL